MSEERRYTADEIRSAFYGQFHKSGDLWFDYLSDDETCSQHTESSWLNFLEILQEQARCKDEARNE